MACFGPYVLVFKKNSGDNDIHNPAPTLFTPTLICIDWNPFLQATITDKLY